MKNLILELYKSGSKIKMALAILIMTIYMIAFIDFKLIKRTRDKLLSTEISNSPLILYWDIFFCTIFLGFDPTEYSAYNFHNKSFNERISFFSNSEKILFSRAININANVEILSKKQNTYKYYKDFFRREQIVIKSNDDFALFKEFIKRHSVFFCKPFNGSCGEGARIVVSNEQSPEIVFNNLISSGIYVLEELIIQCDEMAQFNKSSINTVRTTMLRTNDGVKLLFGFIRCGRNGSIVDNGGSGGIIIPYNPMSGKLYKLGFDELGLTYEKHPDTQVVFENFQIPHWNEICDLSIKLTEMMPNIFYVGWDLAITNNEIMLVEGNSQPMFIGLQGLHSIGFKKELKFIIKNRTIPKSFREKQEILFS